jgi:hypothetical protein
VFEKRVIMNQFVLAKMVEAFAGEKAQKSARSRGEYDAAPRLSEYTAAMFAGMTLRQQAERVQFLGWTLRQKIGAEQMEIEGGTHALKDGVRRYHTAMRMWGTSLGLYLTSRRELRGVTLPLLAAGRHLGLPALPSRDQWAIQSLVGDAIPYTGRGMDMGEETPLMRWEDNPTVEETMAQLRQVVVLCLLISRV